MTEGNRGNDKGSDSKNTPLKLQACPGLHDFWGEEGVSVSGQQPRIAARIALATSALIGDELSCVCMGHGLTEGAANPLSGIAILIQTIKISRSNFMALC